MKYSVVVVNYNKENSLKKCLDSIINQTYKNFELIIVDDGSTDGSRSIINSYRKYDNVTIYFKENTGIADARNFAIQKVRTKYFTFVDSDDYIDSNLLEECSKYKNYDMISFGCYYVYPKLLKQKIIRNSKGEFQSENGEEVLKQYIDKLCLFLVPWGYMYNIELFKKLSYIANYIHEDVYLTTLLILKSKQTITLDYCGYYYVQSQESITRTKNEQKMREKMKSMIYNYDYLKEYFCENIKDDCLKEKYIGYYANLLLSTGTDFSHRVKNDFCIELEKRKLYNDFNNDLSMNKLRYVLCKKSFKLYYMLYFYITIGAPIYYRLKNLCFFLYYSIVKESYYLCIRILRLYYSIVKQSYYLCIRILRYIYYIYTIYNIHYSIINGNSYSIYKRKLRGDNNVKK